MIEKISRIDEKDQILVSCYHMICYIQNLHYISIYIFIDVFNHGVTKDQKIKEIHQVQQKIFTKHDCMLEIMCFHVMLHLNLKRIGFTGEPVTRRSRQSRANVIHLRT